MALTSADPDLLATALKAPTDPDILEVALTRSSPGLLAVALQDATKENLRVALTPAWTRILGGQIIIEISDNCQTAQTILIVTVDMLPGCLVEK